MALDSKYIYATGRRKTSVASVRVYQMKGVNTVNGASIDKAVPTNKLRNSITEPLKVLELDDKFYFSAKVNGGGSSSQVGAISHGVARALSTLSSEYKIKLRKAGLLTRDPRMVERKKIGLKKARKAPQYSKR